MSCTVTIKLILATDDPQEAAEGAWELVDNVRGDLIGNDVIVRDGKVTHVKED